MEKLQERTTWIKAADWAALAARGRLVFRHEGRQIALFLAGDRLFACNNRCPHEGYPLIEGTLAGDCLLTCNWHNWKFDLASGETLVGGDRLRLYPVRREGEAVLVDLAEPPAEARQAAALADLKGAFRRLEYDRMARCLARLQQAGGEPLEALRTAIGWTHERLEFGMTHALAAAPDWLAVGESAAETPAERLVPFLEILAHLADDTLREPAYPYSEATLPWSREALLAAIEAEDEAAAVARLRGALVEGVAPGELFGALAEAALAHYADFGHALIYVEKTEEFLGRLGPTAAEPLLLALVRSLVMATREDLIPEFRGYAAALAAWDGQGPARPTAEAFLGRGVKGCLELAAAASGEPEALHRALLEAIAWQLLHFDQRFQDRNDRPLAENATFLDVTHGLTFAAAMRWAVTRWPRLQPAGLLQLACFVGRNNGFVDRALDEAAWAVADLPAFFADQRRALLDHRERQFILAAHRVKVLTAAEREAALLGAEDPLARLIAAAVGRYLASEVRLKQPLRTARQALAFVAEE